MKKIIHLIAAARPNFMKIAPLYHALKDQAWAEPLIVHTGQHYDVNMSDAFFKDLGLPEPHYHLGIGSGSHAEQTGYVMIAYEKLIMKTRPDMLVVVGDVNSTVACAMAAAKILYSSFTDKGEPTNGSGNRFRPLIAHLEAGLRSFDCSMPEEINRVLTDILSDVLWTSSPEGDENLAKEGVSKAKIERVGNIMIDSLEMMRSSIETNGTVTQLGLQAGGYAVVTLHRPANVDRLGVLAEICEKLVKISKHLPLVFPCHPRTRKMLEASGNAYLLLAEKAIRLMEPLSYLPFMNLVFNSRCVITDSGGIQEETTYIGKPCLTLRPNTERPVTVTEGTNRLCAVKDLENEVDAILNSGFRPGRIPDLWDGRTAARVTASIGRFLSN